MNAELKRLKPVPEFKKKIVAELEKLIKENRTLLLASVSNLPASQYQQIAKKLRGKAIVKVPKRNLFFRAVEDIKNIGEINQIEEYFKGGVALLFSNSDCFDLAADLIANKTPAKAKPGQIAPEDISISAGPTDLPPGPAISELGSVGLQIEIKEGKIHIKSTKVIVKKGEAISQKASDIMTKLNVKPFSIGFIPLSAYDTKEKKLYKEIKIDKEGNLANLKNSFSKALAFGVSIGYTNEETIKFLLQKAGRHENVLRLKVNTPEIKSGEELK